METELFSWEEWDMLDTACFTFYNVVLVRKIGNFEAGTKFSYANMDYTEGKLVLSPNDSGENEFTFKLSLNVSEDAQA